MLTNVIHHQASPTTEQAVIQASHPLFNHIT